MKEYKIITPSLGFRNRMEKLEDILNTYAREGWYVKESNFGEAVTIILERAKNR